MLLDGLARARRAQRRCGRGVLLSDYSVEPLSLIGYGLCGLLVGRNLVGCRMQAYGRVDY